jgi:hypothetical protein
MLSARAVYISWLAVYTPINEKASHGKVTVVYMTDKTIPYFTDIATNHLCGGTYFEDSCFAESAEKSWLSARVLGPGAVIILDARANSECPDFHDLETNFKAKRLAIMLAAPCDQAVVCVSWWQRPCTGCQQRTGHCRRRIY